MKSRRRSLSGIRLYLIASISGHSQCGLVYNRSKAALRSGIKLLQLRCKTIDDVNFLELAQRFRSLTLRHNALFIINDRADIALICKADGVHLGQEDIPIACARGIVGKDKIIGKSTHSLKQALKAQSEHADYIGFGPIFKTPTKPAVRAIGPDALMTLTKKINIPYFAIGGIDQRNVKRLISCGAGKVAVSSAILSKKNIEKAVKELGRSLKAPLH